MNQNHSAYYLKAEETGTIVYHNNAQRLDTNGVGVTIYHQLDTTDLTAIGGNFTGIVTASDFIGGGINSEIGLVHKNALDITQKFSLLAGCFSKDRKINKLSGEFFKIRNENIFENLELLLTQASSKLDALIILTPPNLHFDNIKTILKYKIPIISEKSLVLKSKEINEIKKLLNNSNTFLTVTYNYTGYSMIREIQDFIKKGKLGRINKFLIEMPQDSY